MLMVGVLISGDKALADLLAAVDEALDSCTDPHLKNAIKKVAGDIKSMTDALKELRANGQVCRITYWYDNSSCFLIRR